MSSDAFLNAVFHPKTAPRPTGLRRASASMNSLRKASRVRAFNKLDPLKQQIIIRAGNKESYLRGNSSIADSRASLRVQAVGKGIAKPVTPSSVAAGKIVAAASQRPAFDGAGKPKGDVNPDAVLRNVRKMTPSQKRRAEGVTSYEDLLEMIDETRDDEGYSPFFYK